MEHLTEDDITHAVCAIEGDEFIVKFLRQNIGEGKKNLSKLSLKRVLQLENVVEIVIENVYAEGKTSISKGKKNTLCKFVNSHPWLHIDDQKPFESLCYWMRVFKKNVNDASIIVIHTNGVLEPVNKDAYFS